MLLYFVGPKHPSGNCYISCFLTDRTAMIMPKSEDKYVEKVFNSTELHISEVTSFKIGTLECLLIFKKSNNLKIFS